MCIVMALHRQIAAKFLRLSNGLFRYFTKFTMDSGIDMCNELIYNPIYHNGYISNIYITMHAAVAVSPLYIVPFFDQ